MSKSKWEITPEQAAAIEQQVKALEAGEYNAAAEEAKIAANTTPVSDELDSIPEGSTLVGTVRVKRGWHGWHRGYTVVIDGIPRLTHVVAWFFDYDDARFYAKQVAQIIVDMMKRRQK